MHADVANYIQSQKPEVQKLLLQIRSLILDAAPTAVEGFAYQMPSYKLHNKPLVYFAAAKKHIGLYATPSANEAFADELSKFVTGKGSIQFALDKKLPTALITKIVKFKVKEIEAKKKIAVKKLG